MKVCRDCQKPIPYASTLWGGSVCPRCRGLRTAEINREKVKKHGPSYFDRRSPDARRQAV